MTASHSEFDAAVARGVQKLKQERIPLEYQCPACESGDVWFDYSIDARQAANPNLNGDHPIEECDSGGQRNDCFITCRACGDYSDLPEEWNTANRTSDE